jgi:hypothetical protein
LKNFPRPQESGSQKACKTLLQVKQNFVIGENWQIWSARLRPGVFQKNNHRAGPEIGAPAAATFIGRKEAQ